MCLEYLRVYSIHVHRQCFLWGSTHLAKYAREENMQSHSFWNICYFFCSESQAILKRKLKLLQIFDIKVKISVLSSVLSCVVIFPWTNVAQISKDQHWILHLFLQNQLILGYKLQRRSRLGWLWAQISKHLVGTPSSITKKSLCVCLSKKCSWGTCMCRINSTLLYVVLSKQTAPLQSLNMWPSNKPFKHLWKKDFLASPFLQSGHI